MSKNYFKSKCSGHTMYDFKDKDQCLNNYILQNLCRTQQIFKYNNLPDSIPQYILEMLLQVNGFACIAKHDGTLYAFYGGLGGEPDVYYRPTICTVANPALNLSQEFKIDEDCVILKNDAFMQGLMPLFKRYLSALVENDITLLKASKNLRISGVFSATDDATMLSAKKYMEDIDKGEDGIVASSEFLEGIKVQPLANSNGNITQLLELQQYIKAGLYNELGLNSNFNMKREILTRGENQMNVDSLIPFIDHMLETRQADIEKVNAMFGTNISIELNSVWNDQREMMETLEEETTSPIEEPQEGITESTEAEETTESTEEDKKEEDKEKEGEE